MEMKLSIIVPVYNMEQYIRTCLDSILSCEFEGMEVLCVDDGSDDGSNAVIREYAEKDGRIAIVEKENGGLSSARNAGIQAAKGKYIMFADPDDYLESKILGSLYEAICQTQSQIVVCPYYRQSIAGEVDVLADLPLKNNQVVTGKEYLALSGNITTVCNKIYEKAFIEKYKFYDIWYEDVAWTPIVMSYAERVCYIEKPFYHYIRREGSIVSSENDLRSLESIQALDYAMNEGNPEAKEEIAHYVARQLQYMMIRRKSYADCYANRIHELEDYLKKSEMVMADEQLVKRLSPFWGDYISIPKVIYYDDFGNDGPSQEKEEFLRDFKEGLLGSQGTVICLDEENCNIEEDEAVKRAYDLGNYKLVGHYFKLKKLYEEGGIAVTKNVKPVKFIVPLLTRSQAFFGFYNGNHIMEDVYGARDHMGIIEELLESCKSVIAEEISFESVLERRLLSDEKVEYTFDFDRNFKKKYVPLQEGDIRIYGSSVLAYDYGMKYAFTKLADACIPFGQPDEECDRKKYLVDQFYLDTLLPLFAAQVDYRVEENAREITRKMERIVRQKEGRIKRLEKDMDFLQSHKLLWLHYRILKKFSKEK